MLPRYHDVSLSALPHPSCHDERSPLELCAEKKIFPSPKFLCQVSCLHGNRAEVQVMAAAMAAMEVAMVAVMLLFSQTQVFFGLQGHQDFQDGLESRFLGCTPKMDLEQLE